MQGLSDDLTYDGPLFDAHTHVVEREYLALLVRTGIKYGVERALVVLHGHTPHDISREHPGRFVFARYFTGWSLFGGEVDSQLALVRDMAEEGYAVAKVHFAPVWHDRLGGEDVPPIDSPVLDSFFESLRDLEIPVVVHVADPDTYFATRYRNTSVYGTKDQHIADFEHRLDRTPGLRVQAAHLAAQPEPRWLPHLDVMLSRWPHLYVDTSSARWMARELSKDPTAARRLLIRHSKRVLFGTDCVTRSADPSYYEGRYLALRLLFESQVRHVPLPFPDPDTQDCGGTFINGLGLPDSVLDRIYWLNALGLYGLDG